MIKTRWLTDYYNPQQEPLEARTETDHHLVYAAMLDGVIGGKRIADYTCVPPTTVNRDAEKRIKRTETERILRDNKHLAAWTI